MGFRGAALNKFLLKGWFEFLQGNDKLLDVVFLKALPRDNRSPPAGLRAPEKDVCDPVVLAEYALRVLNLSQPPATLSGDASAARFVEGQGHQYEEQKRASECTIQQGDVPQVHSAGLAELATMSSPKYDPGQDSCAGKGHVREAQGNSAVLGEPPSGEGHGFDSREGGGEIPSMLLSAQPVLIDEQETEPADSPPDKGLGLDDPREWDPGPSVDPLQEAPLGLMPVVAAYVAGDRKRLYIVYDYIPHSLGSLLQYSPGALGDDAAKRLLLLQLLTPLEAVHAQGLWHGALSLDSISVSDHRFAFIS